MTLSSERLDAHVKIAEAGRAGDCLFFPELSPEMSTTQSRSDLSVHSPKSKAPKILGMVGSLLLARIWGLLGSNHLLLSNEAQTKAGQRPGAFGRPQAGPLARAQPC